MTIAPERDSESRHLYGWIERPSSFTGAVSAFDFLGLTKWWRGQRFRGDADRVALMGDYHNIAADLRRAYYETLREEGLNPCLEPHRTDQHRQISFFDREEYRVKK